MRSAAYANAQNAAQQSALWLSEIRALVKTREHLVLRPKRAALLVVDMQRYFAAPAGRCFLPATSAIVPQIAALLGAWRAAGSLVVFTQHRHAGPLDLGMLGKFFDDYIREGEPESEIIAPLAPRPFELVIGKTTYDAFLGTELELELRQRAIEQVLITGVLTHMCCETTARSAFCRGFEVFVAADGTASSTEALHVSSLRAMADAVAVLLSTDEAIARCRQLT